MLNQRYLNDLIRLDWIFGSVVVVVMVWLLWWCSCCGSVVVAVVWLLRWCGSVRRLSGYGGLVREGQVVW